MLMNQQCRRSHAGAGATEEEEELGITSARRRGYLPRMRCAAHLSSYGVPPLGNYHPRFDIFFPYRFRMRRCSLLNDCTLTAATSIRLHAWGARVPTNGLQEEEEVVVAAPTMGSRFSPTILVFSSSPRVTFAKEEPDEPWDYYEGPLNASCGKEPRGTKTSMGHEGNEVRRRRIRWKPINHEEEISPYRELLL